VKQNIDIQNLAKQADLSGELSALHIIDLSLLAGSVRIVHVNYNQYIDIVSSYGLVLDRQDVLVLPFVESNVVADGFVSIYDKLIDKFSFCLANNFKGVRLLIVLDGVTSYSYNATIKEVVVNSDVTYEQSINMLASIGYERVDFIEQPKQYCLKGGIIDVYSPLSSLPYRICFYDGEFSIKNYQINTGLSVGPILDNLVLLKNSVEETTINLDDVLLRFKSINNGLVNSCSDYKFPVLPVEHSVLLKEKQSAIFSDSLFFSSYKIDNCLIAPKHLEKSRSEVYAQQEDVALEVGDLVCHEDFGVGKLVGFVSSADEDGEDYLKINYEDASVQLSVKSLFKLSFVSRETSDDLVLGSLSKKGRWVKQKKSLLGDIDNNVKGIIDFYANKKKIYRTPFPYGGKLEREFLDSFGYEETKDQSVVWSEIVSDLEDSCPMYRLVCGDVGFGKTELAIRAAFRVVVNGGKVLVMAPTSILSRQLFEVFGLRLGSFGVSVGLYTGACSSIDRNSVKDAWVQGACDVVIGTNSITYDDVFIKLSNMIIIDEEHRFGVKDKEGFLEGYETKDVLLMSATPIPRSLNLSLSGLNDISTLGTPPVLRRPIQTFISYFNDVVIKRSVEYELNRGGQVFFVHNNIQSMPSIKSYIKRLLPNINIVLAHSRLSKKELKNNVLDFINKGADLLLCTSIIGSGVDIPNANTIIINNSHRFGLGQLHQIRGRVGRSEKQGYAYMLLPENSSLSVVAKKRLVTIEKNVSLGSGYHIAKSDLNIRGGGLLFGFKQSGKSFDFGFEFYSKLMSRSIEKFSGSTLQGFVDNFVYKVFFSAFFSSSFIPGSVERLRAYRLLNSIYSAPKVNRFVENLIDSYGPLPDSAKNLVSLRLVSILAFDLFITSIDCSDSHIVLSFNSSFNKGEQLFKFLSDHAKDFDVQSYSFDQREHVTLLNLKHNNNNINGEFLVGFFKAFKTVL